MVNTIKRLTTEKTFSQATSSSHALNMGLDSLPTELLLKIAGYAGVGIATMRLLNKQIESSVREGSTLARLTPNAEQPFSTLAVAFPHNARFASLKALYFGNKKMIDSDGGASERFPIYPKLEKLSFELNPTRNSLIFTLVNSQNLRSIKLGNCQDIANNALVSLFRFIPNLEEIKLRSARLNNADFVQFNHPQLFSLKIHDSPFLTNEFLENLLIGASNLRVLTISNCAQIASQTLSKATTHKLVALKVKLKRDSFNVQKWDLSFFIDLILRNSKLSQLLFINYFCDLAGPIDHNHQLVAFPQLLTLKLFCVDLARFVFLLPAAKQLENLELFSCGDSQVLNGRIDGFPKLKTLSLRGSSDINDQLFELLVSKTNQLTKLKFSDCRVTDAIWEWLDLSHLRFLYLGTDDGPHFKNNKKMGDFFRKALKLEELIFQFDYDPVSHESLGDLSGCLQHLKKIEWRWFDYADDMIFEMVDQARNLETLMLRSCDNIRLDTVLEAIYECPKLDKISIQECEYITKDAEEKINNLMFNLRGVKNKGSFEKNDIFYSDL